MKKIWFCVAAAVLATATAHAQQPSKPPSSSKPAGKKPKLGASKADGHGRSIANDQQQIQADQNRLRQDKQNRDQRKYDKDARQMQRDQEQLNRDTTRSPR